MRPIWGGSNSLRNALKSKKLLNKYEIYTFDIVEESNGFKNIVLDLAQDNLCEVFQKLIDNKTIKKCDYIVASPNCQSFSVAMQSVSNHKSNSGKYFSGNPHRYWDCEKQEVCNWPSNKNVTWNGFCGNSYPSGTKSVPKFVGELGNRCIENTIKLIAHFRPKCWYIENPAKSLMWKYIKHNLKFKPGVENVAHYSAYSDNYSRKPTCFLSNVDLDLKKIKTGLSVKKVDENNYLLILSGACRDNVKDELKRQRAELKLAKTLNKKVSVKLSYKKNAMERSSIPNELLVEIIKSFDKFDIKNDLSNKSYEVKFKLTPWTKKIALKQMRKEVSI
ncbi:MAG: DNA cytosine methyltransferase [Mycoplasmataceae bacterium]|nr:DNA cytosine methyltransferase [Mycoplasmataceae bacterium]